MELFSQSECKCECEWAKGKEEKEERHTHLNAEAGRAGNGARNAENLQTNDRNRSYRVCQNILTTVSVLLGFSHHTDIGTVF